jgi:hypothetical protein
MFGKDVTRMFYIASSIGAGSTSFCCFSVMDRLAITFSAETGNIPDIQEFKRLLDARIDEVDIAE